MKEGKISQQRETDKAKLEEEVECESLGGFWSIPAGGSTPATDVAQRGKKENKKIKRT